MKHRKSKLAFSLIELSIVILIIGILVVGISQGSRIVYNARLKTARSLTQNSPVHLNENELALWLETTNEKSFNTNESEDGLSITTWNDINPLASGEFNLTNLGTPPTYAKSLTNGLPTIRFNDTPLGKSNISGSQLSKGNQITIFLVQKHYSNPPENFASPIWWGDASEIILIHALSNSGNFVSDFGVCCGSDARMNFTPVPSSAAFQDKTNIIVSTRRPNGTGFVRFNGIEQHSTSTLTGTVSPSTVSNFIVGNDGMHSDINEIIIFKTALKDSEISDIERYLSSKWGVKLNGL